MPSKILFAVLALLTVSGCAIWDAGYTENKVVSRYSVASVDKVPITYNVSIRSERGDVIALPDVESLRKNIERALKETGMFSEIHYGAKGGVDSYHIEFSFHQGGTSIEDAMAAGIVAGYTLLLFPVWEVITFDGSAVLSLQGKPIYSTAKAEEARCVVWLPLAPIGIFMNSWSVWHYLEKGSVNALCDAIAQEHKKRFLKDSDVVEIKRE
jgi:hypothetical protein